MAKKRKWTNEQLVAAVKNNKSIYGVLTELGLKLSGGSHALIKLYIKQLNLDISHFTGQGWCAGEIHKNFIKKHIEYSLERILVKESTYQSTVGLKKKLFSAGLLQNICYECKMEPIWNEKNLVLHLDHIDGDRCNNTIENLRVVCPNCHSQTNTYCGKNTEKNKQRIKDESEIRDNFIKGNIMEVFYTLTKCLKDDRGSWISSHEVEGVADKHVRAWLGFSRNKKMSGIFKVNKELQSKLSQFDDDLDFETYDYFLERKKRIILKIK